ncbi:MAG: ABC transporter permease [Akkermansia sp.]
MFYRLCSLIIKELRELLGSPRSAAVLLVPVLVQCLLFPHAAIIDITSFSVALLDEDGGAPAAELVQRIDAMPYTTDLRRAAGQTEMLQLIDAQKALVALRIPAGWSRQLARGEEAPLQIICDGRCSNSSQIAAGYLSGVIELFAAERGAPAPQLSLRHLFNPNLSPKWFILPCLIGMISMLTSLNISCMAIARERENGTYEQLCVTPLSAGEILIGKIIPASLIVLVQSSIIAAVAILGYGVPCTGSPAALYTALLLYSVALSGVGFSISTLCRTQQQAFVGMFVFVLPAILLSGFLAPVENMPELLQGAARLDPLYYIFLICRGIFLKGYTLADITGYLGALAGIAVATLATAYALLRR